jgi:hypothetical protein
MTPAEAGGKQLDCSATVVDVILCFLFYLKDGDTAALKRRAGQTRRLTLFLHSKDVGDVRPKRWAISEPRDLRVHRHENLKSDGLQVLLAVT